MPLSTIYQIIAHFVPLCQCYYVIFLIFKHMIPHIFSVASWSLSVLGVKLYYKRYPSLVRGYKTSTHLGKSIKNKHLEKLERA